MILALTILAGVAFAGLGAVTWVLWLEPRIRDWLDI